VADIVKVGVMAHPEHAEHDEADEIDDERVLEREQVVEERVAGGVNLAVGQLDVENEQGHRDGEDAVGQRLDASGAEAPADGRGRTGRFMFHRRTPPRMTGAAPKRAATPAVESGAPSTSSESTSSVPPP